MNLLRLDGVCLSFGGPWLLDRADLEIKPGERLCILGRNGAGKSTVLKLINGEYQAEDGRLIHDPALRIARMDQEMPADDDASVYDAVAEAMEGLSRTLAEFHQAGHEAAGGSEQALERLHQAQHALEAGGGWDIHRRIESTLSRLNLAPDLRFGDLSGGLKRRVLLARALVNDPNLLLLDEPTNHLDIEAIAWLENLLLSRRGSLIFITHDRVFMDRVATRIVELDRGKLTRFPAPYREYLRRKNELLETETTQNALFDKKLAQEEAWIRQGIKARRTRNEGRVRALEAMREERRRRRERQGKARIQVQEAEQSGQLVIETFDAGFQWEDKVIFQGLTTQIQRGDRIGVIGPNGAGKTTLLNVLLGRLPPTQGRVKSGTKLEPAYFDQLRARLNPQQTVVDNLAEGRDFIDINGARKHVIGYLQDFLFTPDRARQPVKSLSGGERNRLLLAKLFTQPCNLLVMDEPTNDLDMETLELLEDRLMNFTGTLLLVSHDRAFLDNVVTSSLAFEGAGVVNEYVGGYSDWLRQRPGQEQPTADQKTQKPETTVREKPAAKPRKRSYKDQRELDALPGLIEALETEQETLHARMSNPAFFRGEKTDILAAQDRLKELETELAEAYERWEALEDF